MMDPNNNGNVQADNPAGFATAAWLDPYGGQESKINQQQMYARILAGIGANMQQRAGNTQVTAPVAGIGSVNVAPGRFDWLGALAPTAAGVWMNNQANNKQDALNATRRGDYDTWQKAVTAAMYPQSQPMPIAAQGVQGVGSQQVPDASVDADGLPVQGMAPQSLQSSNASLQPGQSGANPISMGPEGAVLGTGSMPGQVNQKQLLDLAMHGTQFGPAAAGIQNLLLQRATMMPQVGKLGPGEQMYTFNPQTGKTEWMQSPGGAGSERVAIQGPGGPTGLTHDKYNPADVRDENGQPVQPEHVHERIMGGVTKQIHDTWGTKPEFADYVTQREALDNLKTLPMTDAGSDAFLKNWILLVRPDVKRLPQGEAAAAALMAKNEKWFAELQNEITHTGTLSPETRAQAISAAHQIVTNKSSALNEIAQGPHMFGRQYGLKPNDVNVALGLPMSPLREFNPEEWMMKHGAPHGGAHGNPPPMIPMGPGAQ